RTAASSSGYVAPTTSPRDAGHRLDQAATRSATVRNSGCLLESVVTIRSCKSLEPRLLVLQSTMTPRPAQLKNGASASSPRYGLTVSASKSQVPKTPAA